MKKLVALSLLALLLGFLSGPALARDASFLAPSASSSPRLSGGDGAVAVEPKSEIDLGETGINVAKRTIIFFVNLTNLPVNVLSVRATGDSSVKAEIVSDDCSKIGQIDASSRCSVTVEVTPTAAGQWTAEVLMTHGGEGRLARAKLSGRTKDTGRKKESEGLSLSTKNISPINFEEIEIGSGKAVRSALMVNDSNETITILSIDVIEPENGLERLGQGCMEDMDLKPGESCPVTLLWNPVSSGAVSTDLIIRHSGRLGFAVIPIRGEAEMPENDGKTGQASAGISGGTSVSGDAPTRDELERAISDKLSDISSAPPVLSSEEIPFENATDISELHLIGTVGSRAVFYLPTGRTKVVPIGEVIELGGEDSAELLDVTAKQAKILVDGQEKILSLEVAANLTRKIKKKRTEDAIKATQPSSSRSSRSRSKISFGDGE